jgi:arylsulfatase
MAKDRHSSRLKFAVVVAVALVIILIAAAAFWLFRAGAGRLNLLVISIDTLRADHVSCYGYERRTTPNIDRLASRGHRFSNAYTSIPTTLPAHASLFTSLYATQLSVRRNGEKVSAGATTLAEILAGSGYRTAAFVSAAVLSARYGLDQGFHEYGDTGRRKELHAAETLTKAVKWLRNRPKKPFFLFVHFFDPHGPYTPPSQFSTLFKSQKKHDLPKKLIPGYQRVTDSLDFYDYVDRYDEEIAYSDGAVGKLLQELQQQGLDENTLVVFLSDHGETLGELLTRYGYAFEHGEFLYAHQIHVPVIIREPAQVGQRKVMVHTRPVSFVDIMPTILDLLDVEMSGPTAGVSLLPMMRGEKMPDRPIFTERRTFNNTKLPPYAVGEAHSIIENKRHLILSTFPGTELYDLVEDPSEFTNLSKEQQTEAEALGDKLRSWQSGLKPLFGPSVFETDKEALERLRSLGYVE